MTLYILKVPGITGLKNLGNTCYMNCIVQCLSNTTPLEQYFRTTYLKDVNTANNSRGGEVAEAFAEVVNYLWSGDHESIACDRLKNLVGEHKEQFQGHEQEDACEFLTVLLQLLDEDLKVQIELKQEFKILEK
jgi:ubiquitin C-terminal hydrolase